MKPIRDIEKVDFNSIPVDPFWNSGNEKELKMHRIHAYPTKFPAFITNKALAFAKTKGVKHKRIADIFCGCGTVAFEAKRSNISFWGCDINPVATMIAKVKSRKYRNSLLQNYYEKILKLFNKKSKTNISIKIQNERLRYWYKKNSSTSYLS